MTDRSSNSLGTRRDNRSRAYSKKQSTKQKIVKFVLILVFLVVLVVVIRVVRYTKHNLPPSTALLPVPTEVLEKQASDERGK
jgi:hypothetical protein